MAEVTKALMPQLRGHIGEEGMTRCVDRRKAHGDHTPGPEVLHRKTMRVKFYRIVVVSGKTKNRNKVLDDVGRNKTLFR